MRILQTLGLKGLKRWDYWIYIGILCFSFFGFNHGDITHTIGCSMAYLEGHFADFYDFNKPYFGAVNYLPSTFILFAIWGIPMKILGLTHVHQFGHGVALFWYKILTTLLFLGSAAMLMRISKSLKGIGAGHSWLALIFLTSPMAIYSQFLFGQYDVLTVFFTLWGLAAYFEGKLLQFSWLFGVAMTFKYFPAFVFLPLLLLQEKRVWMLLRYGILFSIPLALEVLFYFRSPAFVSDVLGFEGAKRVSETVVRFGTSEINLIFFGVAALTLVAFLIRPDLRQGTRNRIALILACAPVFGLFGTIGWHPQWLLFLAAFSALAIYASGRIRDFLLLDCLGCVAFFGITVYKFSFNADQRLWNLGIFGRWNPNLFDPKKVYDMKHFIWFRPVSAVLWTTLFDAALWVMLIFLGWSLIEAKRPSTQPAPESHTDLLGPLRLRFLVGMSTFLIPAVFAYFKTLAR